MGVSAGFSSFNGFSDGEDVMGKEIGSRSDSEEEDEGDEEEETRASPAPERWDVLGLGQAMVLLMN